MNKPVLIQVIIFFILSGFTTLNVYEGNYATAVWTGFLTLMVLMLLHKTLD